MRRLAVVGLALLFAPPARAADPVPFHGVVALDEVKVRAGPADRFPETGALARGTAVVVEREEPNGWLAVTAPKGSVSWVAAQFLIDYTAEARTPQLYAVESDVEVNIAAGRAGVDQPLDVRREKVPPGTAVLVIGPPAKFDRRTWVPVEPPAGDVRYVPRTAIRFDRPANAGAFSVRVSEGAAPLPVVPASGGGDPAAAVPGPARVQPAGKPAVNHDLWARAEAAERAGRPAEAEKLYFELAALMNREGGDHDVANLCYTRIHALREKNRAAATGGTTSAKDDRGVRPGPPQAVPPSERPPARASGSGTDAAPAGDRPLWSGAGTLRRSVVTPDGKPTYALEASPGVVKWYVIAGPNVELERWLNKRVEVFGAPQKRDGLSKPVAYATAVEPVP